MRTYEEVEKDIFQGTGSRKLWKVTPESGDTYFVVTSAINNETAHETFVFLCDENGGIIDWNEQVGSFMGDEDHVRAIEGHVNGEERNYSQEEMAISFLLGEKSRPLT